MKIILTRRQSVTTFLGTVHKYTDLKLCGFLSFTMLFARKFLSPFGKTTLWEGKVLQSVSRIVSKATVVIDITRVLSAQTSSFILTVAVSQCKV